MSNFDPVSLALVLALLGLLPTIAVVTTSFLKISIVMSLVRNALGVQQAPPNIALYGIALILSAYVMAPVGMRAYDGILAAQAKEAADPANAAALLPNPAVLLPNPATSFQNGAVSSRNARVPGSNSTHTSNADSISVPLPIAGVLANGRPIHVDALLSGLGEGIKPLKAFMLRNSRPANRLFFVNTARRMWGEQSAIGVDEDNLLVLVPAFMLSELTSAFQMGFLLYLPFVMIDLIVSNILLAMGMMMVSPVTISLPLKLFLFVMVDGWTRLIQSLILSYT